MNEADLLARLTALGLEYEDGASLVAIFGKNWPLVDRRVLRSLVARGEVEMVDAGFYRRRTDPRVA